MGRAHGACEAEARSEEDSDAGASPTMSDAACARNPHASEGFRRSLHAIGGIIPRRGETRRADDDEGTGDGEAGGLAVRSAPGPRPALPLRRLRGGSDRA